ncbi:16S rRNA (uracil(1498)-N(3))-methyltransferase [Candidatus Sumerlaeota bacterium]|nr:16S rRNA (uracil(1498)-N(3))-methyltransferase [Candidatus Sumerlaeota bacterium]
MSRAPYRFYYPGQMGPIAGEEILLPAGESHHLLHVLRLKPEAEVAVFDSRGELWMAALVRSEGTRALLRLAAPLETAAEKTGAGTSRLHVAVSLLKHRAMDWMIEKLCELDVASLQPLICKRTIVAPGEGKSLDPPSRWERIALAAAKQSGRNVPMSFYPITPFNAWLQRERPPALRCFAQSCPEAVGLGEWLGGRAGMGLPVEVAIGPEGGWTPGEVEAFQKAGYTAVALGPLVLRAETAAMTVAAACRVML